MVLALMLAATVLLAPAASAQTPSSKVPTAAATQRLFLAVHDNDLRAVQASVAIGADIAARDRHGLTPSDIAVDKGFFDIAHFLLSVRNLRLDRSAEPGTAAARARRTRPAPVRPSATPAAPASEPPPAVKPRPPIPVLAADETIIGPAGAAPSSVPHDPFDPKIAPLGAVLTIIGPLQGPESLATASAPATAGPGLDESRPPSAAIATEIAEAAAEHAERSGPAAQEPGDPTPSPAAEKGFFRRLVDRLISSDAEPNTDTPSPAPPSPTQASVSDARPEASVPPTPSMPPADGSAGPPKPPVDVAPLPVIEPETAAIPPHAASQPGPPADEPVAATTPAEAPEPAAALEIAKGPLESTSAPPSTIRESPPSETARPGNPFDPDEAPRGAELPIVGETSGPGETAEAAPPPAAAVEAPAVTASAATKIAEAAARTETAAGPTTNSASPETPPASATAKESGGETARPGPLGRLYQAVENLFGASEEPKKRPEPRQATIETASLPIERDEAAVAPPRPQPERYLKGVPLTIADAIGVGTRKFPQTPVAHAPENCIRKQRGTILFCVEPVAWPGDIEEHFAISTFFYRGTNAIVRYEEGESRYIYALFVTDGFEAVSAHFRARYGPPTSTVQRRITLMAAPRMTSPAMIWKSADETSGAVTTLEVRKYDDSRGGFADVRHGAVLLRRDGTEPIFPRLSTLELMVLK